MLYVEGAAGISDHWQAAARMAINMHNTIWTFHKSLQANAHIILIQHRINSVRVSKCMCVCEWVCVAIMANYLGKVYAKSVSQHLSQRAEVAALMLMCLP